MTVERVFELQDLVGQLEKAGNYFIDFLKAGNLEAGIIVLHAGEKDTQKPHAADELYYIIEGSGFMELGKCKQPVKKGSIIFVPAKMNHRFYCNREDLVILYLFAEQKDTKEPSVASNVNANYGCSKETDCAAAQVVLQNMLQMRGQEPYLGYKVQEVPWQPDEAKEQNAWSQEIIFLLLS